jgi:hypothetical protein
VERFYPSEARAILEIHDDGAQEENDGDGVNLRDLERPWSKR